MRGLFYEKHHDFQKKEPTAFRRGGSFPVQFEKKERFMREGVNGEW